MVSWELGTTKFLGVFHLNSIKSKIIVFALLATLIPSLTMGWLSYGHNRQFLDAKINQELLNVTSQASRELGLWLKERLYEMRVFSSSYVISENLEKIFQGRLSKGEKEEALNCVKDYTASVRGKFVDYEEIMVVDADGNKIATSSEKDTTPSLPPGWLKRAQAGKPVVGQPAWDDVLKRGVMVIAHPIVSGDNQLLGVLAAKLNFKTVGVILRNYGLEEAGELYVVTQEGILLRSTRPITTGFMQTRLARPFAKRLYSNEAVAVDYRNYLGKDVVGTLKRVPDLDWGVVAEKEKSMAYAQIFKLRNMTVAFVAALLFVIGLCAYLLGLTIVRPLNRLISGADKVASGDLDVDLPVNGGGELGFMTKVFNHMVARLRQGREELDQMNQTLRRRNEELHELSITDSLTGLHNRKHLMETLATEVNRSDRYQRPFAVLMIDIDHFKQYNDTFGHPAGDEVLKKMADVFRSNLRSCDYAARYGGEEFLIMLSETGIDKGTSAAERLRNQVAEENFDKDGREFAITISVGVAICPEHGNDSEALISAADTALYKAKENGRNQVVLAANTVEKPKSDSKVKYIRKP